jgi:hypothetical protein
LFLKVETNYKKKKAMIYVNVDEGVSRVVFQQYKYKKIQVVEELLATTPETGTKIEDLKFDCDLGLFENEPEDGEDNKQEKKQDIIEQPVPRSSPENYSSPRAIYDTTRSFTAPSLATETKLQEIYDLISVERKRLEEFIKSTKEEKNAKDCKDAQEFKNTLDSVSELKEIVKPIVSTVNNNQKIVMDLITQTSFLSTKLTEINTKIHLQEIYGKKTRFILFEFGAVAMFGVVVGVVLCFFRDMNSEISYSSYYPS